MPDDLREETTTPAACWCPGCQERYEDCLPASEQPDAEGERLADGRLVRWHLACLMQHLHDRRIRKETKL